MRGSKLLTMFSSSMSENDPPGGDVDRFDVDWRSLAVNGECELGEPENESSRAISFNGERKSCSGELEGPPKPPNDVEDDNLM